MTPRHRLDPNTLSSDRIASPAIGAAGLALTYIGCYYTLRLPRRVSAVIAYAFGIIATLYLWDNPAVLADTQARIALAIIAAVIGVAFSVRRVFG